MSFTYSPAPLLSGYLGDREVAACFSPKVDLSAMAVFEAALARACAQVGLIPAEAAGRIANACAIYEPDLPAIAVAIGRDGVAVPEMLRQLREQLRTDDAPHLHFGATSQDVIDTSLMLRLKPVMAKLKARVSECIAALIALDARFGKRTLAARTRMQLALPMTVSARLTSWRQPLLSLSERFDRIADTGLLLQLGGPVGDSRAYGEYRGQVGQAMAGMLGLVDAAPWHSNRLPVIDIANAMTALTGTLGKMGQDMCLMAQNEFAEISVSGSGGSSAMAHKQNPVKAEALVTLARFNASLVSAMQHSAVHEQERSGAAWSLEWMVLPQICVAAGAASRTAAELLANIQSIGNDRG